MTIKKSSRRGLSQTIAAGSIMVQTAATLSLKTEDFPDSLTPKEQAQLVVLRARLHHESQLMLKFAHKLRKPSATQ